MTTLHVATPAEVDAATLYAILRLRSEVFVVEQNCPYQDIDGRDLEAGTRHLWLTAATGHVNDRAPLAYLRILDAQRSSDDAPARIGRVCVGPAARRQGHAAMLMTAALEIIGDREVVLDAQAYATNLYLAVGFVPNGPEFLEDGIPHIPMRRPARR